MNRIKVKLKPEAILKQEPKLKVGRVKHQGLPWAEDKKVPNTSEYLIQRYYSLLSQEHRTNKIQTNRIDFYTDGSWTPSRGAGYGLFCSYVNNPELDFIISKRLPKPTTNNVAELSAIIRALEELKAGNILTPEAISGSDKAGSEIRIISDSEYAVGVITGQKNAKANIELVSYARQLLQDIPHNIVWKLVRSHTNHSSSEAYGNDIADHLAKIGYL